MNLLKFIFIPVVLIVIAAGDQCRLRPFHLQDQIYGSCPDFADLSPRNESNYAIAAGPYPCGTCLQITYQSRLQHVIIVDSVKSPGVDLHLEPLSKLANSPDPSVLVQGLIGCDAQVVPLEMCNPNLPSPGAIQTASIPEQIGVGAQQPLKQPWMDPDSAFGPMPNQNLFTQPMQSQNFNRNGIFEFNGNQQQQPNLMATQANFIQQPFQPNSYLQQQQQPGWPGYVLNNQAQLQRGQMPQNPPMFLRRKTQIRVYD